MLDLHLVEENLTILGKLNLTGSTDEHLDSSLRSEVGLKDLLKTLGGLDVDLECLGTLDHISFFVDVVERTHI